MEHRHEFTEEMLRQMYQRRGYQVMRLCGEVTSDRQKVMELTFQAFGEAHRQLLSSNEPITAELQDSVLLECTRRILQKAMPVQEQPLEQPAAQPAEVMPEPEEVLPVEEALPVVEEVSLEEEASEVLAEEAPMEEPVEAAAPAEEPVEESIEAAVPVQEPVVEPVVPAEENENGRTMVEKFNDMQGEEEPLDLTDTSGSNFGWTLLVFVLFIVVLALLWAIWGVAQTIFPIPQLDLGYQWFNANVYPLF
ncbi:MAG: hypothetical protein IKU72_01670 [Oscillospiraceae bacterium]|nr:hypothetical protein [Oscillospiraceae bacterium]